MLANLQGQVLTPQGLRAARLEFESHITALSPVVQEDHAPYILPGFIDTHVHGGGGGDTMDGPSGVRTLARFHLSHGTTTLYPTTITNPWPKIMAALEGVKMLRQEVPGDLPDIPGAHLEGPFISPERLGAQPPQALVPTEALVKEILQLEVVKLVTLAPEIPGALLAAQQFAQAGVRLSIGHTRASYEEVEAFLACLQKQGASLGFTHLFNAMGGLEGRNPGVVGAALTSSFSYAELILDLHHVHKASFLMALQAKPDKLSLVTDAIRACGMLEGKSELGGQEIYIKDGKASLSDGTLAGSLLSLDQALRNALDLGLSLAKASDLLSTTPARYMGLSDRGSLVVGKRADLVVLDKNLHVLEVYVAGKKVFG